MNNKKKVGYNMKNASKKILPINKKPIIMCYGEHANWLSILTNDFRNDDIMAIISDLSWNINGINTYDFEVTNSNIRYEEKNNDIFIKADRYAQNMNFQTYNTVTGNSTLKVHIKWQMMTAPWASCTLFIMNDENRDNFDRNKDFFIGRYIKTGFYKAINNNEIKLDIENQKDDFWLMIDIKDSIAYTSLSYDNNNWVTISEDFIDLQNEYKLGFNLYLCENQIYNWFFTNYIQINCYDDFNFHHPLDFYLPAQKDFYCNIHHPLLSFINMDKIMFNDIGISIIDYIKTNINHNKYVEMYTNEFYIPERDDNNKNYFEHINMVYGYDDEKEILYICGYGYKQIYTYTEVSYQNFTLSFTSCKRNDFITSTYIDFPCYLVDFKIQQVILKLEDYINSYNSSLRLEQFDQITHGINYGISIYDVILKNKDNFLKFIGDKRISHLVYEHKKCMLLRLEFLFKRNYLKEHEYQELYCEFEKLLSLSLITRNLVLKIAINYSEGSQNSIINNIINYINKMKELEIEFIPKLINMLKDNVNQP